MSFEAWSLPGTFRPGEGERAHLTAGDFPALEYPIFSPRRFGELLESLRTARGILFKTPVNRILMAVDQVAFRLLDPDDPLRREALEEIGAHGGLSEPMARVILDRMAKDWTRPALEALLHAEFRNPGVLDRFCPSPSGGEVRAAGYPLSFHLGAGAVPGVSTTSLIRSLLVKSAVLLKPGRGDVPLSVLFGRALRDVDPELAQAMAVIYWPQAEGKETEAALAGADQVVVYGGDGTVEWVRARIPLTTHLVAYRHRLGVGVVGRDALRRGGGPGKPTGSRSDAPGFRETALAAARAAAIFDQRGCVSPHVFFLEEGGEMGPLEWTELLSRALEGLEQDLPSGRLSPGDGVVLQQLRGEAEVEESLGRGRVFHGGADAPWTVLFDPPGGLEPSCLNRTVRVLPVEDVKDVLSLLKPWKSHLQTIGVAGLGDRRAGFLDGLVEMGVSRVAELEGIPWPPPWWHHDGSGPLHSLVRWTDAEGV
ncbi:MAG: acyl-CoA reductase [Longimicrobiales bacterium]